jgi:hypothetical protein
MTLGLDSYEQDWSWTIHDEYAHAASSPLPIFKCFS